MKNTWANLVQIFASEVSLGYFFQVFDGGCTPKPLLQLNLWHQASPHSQVTRTYIQKLNRTHHIMFSTTQTFENVNIYKTYMSLFGVDFLSSKFLQAFILKISQTPNAIYTDMH